VPESQHGLSVPGYGYGYGGRGPGRIVSPGEVRPSQLTGTYIKTSQLVDFYSNKATVSIPVVISDTWWRNFEKHMWHIIFGEIKSSACFNSYRYFRLLVFTVPGTGMSYSDSDFHQVFDPVVNPIRAAFDNIYLLFIISYFALTFSITVTHFSDI
jgi:hypothetical protein